MNFLKNKNLIKLYNCFFCHNKKSFNFPKLKNQYLDYLFYSVNQYKIKKNFLNRKNFIMSSQVQNLSLINLINIIYFISNL